LVGTFTLLVSDEVKRTVIGDDVEVERNGRMPAVDGQIKDLIVFRDVVIFGQHLHGLLVGLCVLWRTMSDLKIGKWRLLELPKDFVDFLEQLERENCEGRGQTHRHFRYYRVRKALNSICGSN